ncbi:MAG: N-acetylmuramoyl-L-alanine amidase, partial [Flavobacteriaceae bacterium]
ISRTQSNKVYRYFYGETPDYETALNMKAEAVKLGYTSAFVVAYQNDTRISVENALKTKTN